MSYLALVLTEKSRATLLSHFPPKFPDVIAHHVTLQFGVPKKDIEEEIVPFWVVAYVCDESLEAVVVASSGDDRTYYGKVLHITLSLDRSKGRKPKDSNEVIKNMPYDKIVFMTPILLEGVLKYLD